MVRLAAVAAVGVIGGDAASALLKDAILDRDFESKATDEKRRFMEVYGTLCNGRVNFLKAFIDGKHGEVSEMTRACAAYGLATAGGSAAQKTLETILTSGEGPLKYAASEAISIIGGRTNVSSGD
jgi:hypothetical protein